MHAFWLVLTYMYVLEDRYIDYVRLRQIAIFVLVKVEKGPSFELFWKFLK